MKNIIFTTVEALILRKFENFWSDPDPNEHENQDPDPNKVGSDPQHYLKGTKPRHFYD